ncbi:MAG: DUF11 domain-containing protein [Gammaproteobacteria bacterium]|nr:DUF11 domain-containing protein [Gammaproteobacteria bacterium]
MNMITGRISLKVIWISILAFSVVFLGLVTEVRAETFTLDFNSLPSNQGWTYRGSPLMEQETYIVDGSSLLQTTVGSGSATASYRMDNIVNSSEPMTLSFTSRVLSHEILTGGNLGWSFYFQIYDLAAILRLGMTDNAVIVNGQSFNLDTTVFHDFVWEYLPGGDYEFFVDGLLLTSGNSFIQSGENFISFGDRTSNENADVEITAFSFSVVSGAVPDVNVQKSVNNLYPMANEPVEFTVEVSNVGIGTASDLIVVDQLPVEMSIPSGTAPFTSVGSYDPATGEWAIGDLDVGVEAVLVVPAVVTDLQAAACVVNSAVASHPRDLNNANDVALAVIHQNDIVHCVDLEVNFGISSDSHPIFPSCNSEDRYQGDAEITNHGPDAARNVVVTITQNPVVGPNLRFDDADCSNAPAAQCNITGIAVGETVTIDVTSDLYQSHNSLTQTISVGAITSDSEYYPSNNNPSASGSAGGFSSCVEPDFPDIPTPFSGGGGCFVATAAYGSPLHPHLDSLRDFRDRFMVTNRPGRALVRFYYLHSPPLADLMADRDWLRAIVRGMLIPIVYTIKYPGLAALLILGLIAVAIARRQRRLAEAAQFESHTMIASGR